MYEQPKTDGADWLYLAWQIAIGLIIVGVLVFSWLTFWSGSRKTKK